MSQPILRHQRGRPQRGRTAAGATILALLLAVLPACDALSTDPLLTAEENRNKPGGTTASLKPVTISPREVSLGGIGQTHQLAVTVLNPAGKARQNPAVTWRSLNPGVAKVDSKGKVTAAAVGLALITATYGANADTARVSVQQAAPPAPGVPTVATVAVTPASSTLEIGRTLQLTAVARDAGGTVLQRTFTWTSANPALVSVSQSGSITAHAAGVVGIQAESEGKAAVALITVPAPASQPSPSIAEVRCSSHPEWDCVVQDQSLTGDIVVPDGQKWLIGRNVEVRGSVRTHNGTIAMRPGSTLRFVGLDINKVVGGGMHWTPEMANDYGLWIGQGHHATGRLDIDCNADARTSWSRTGNESNWRAGDELWIAPTQPGDFSPRRWQSGQPIPQAAPGLPRAEVANVTRSCVIEGPGHILIHSKAPHRVIGVRLERMGLITPSRGATSGRYALHFHHAGELPAGAIVYRTAAVNSGGRVFVPHASHNISWIDVVSVNSASTGFWWDPGAANASNNIMVQGLLVMGVRLPAGAANVAGASDAVVLEQGLNVAIRHSAAAGADGDGFTWPQGGESSWYFSDNSSHNNRGHGISFHHLLGAQDPKERNASYHNAGGGFFNFGGPNVWDDLVLVGNGATQASSATVWGNGRLGELRRPRIQSATGPAIVVSGLANAPAGRTVYSDCNLTSAAGHPKVRIDGGAHPWRAHFRRCGMTPEDVVMRAPISSGLEGTSVLIDHEDGRKWEIVVQGGQRIVRTL